MTANLSNWSEQLRRFDDALGRLIVEGQVIGIRPPSGSEWFELLRHKLLPQVTSEVWLVAAVVGGTNIGKSVVFNHLAGETISAASPLAAKTRHPVCIVPPRFADEPTLASIFTGFALRAWSSERDPWDECDEARLFWRVGTHVPPRLLLLDTPDIDSDAPINWQRADIVRQVADVLIAVLTQQKYNDAAVKQFFRKAAEADKPVIVVFNQCDLVEDREHWPLWLETFVNETGVDVQQVYVSPYDRAAAGKLTLPFYEVGRDGKSPPQLTATLRDELGSLRFDEIKLRTLRGAWRRVVDPEQGVSRYLADVARSSSEYSSALTALGGERIARPDWPALPPALLVNEMRTWWDSRRDSWTRRIHGAYRTLGEGIIWPVRKAWTLWAGQAPDPLQMFHRLERDSIVAAMQALFDDLERLAEAGNVILREALQPLVGGSRRAEFLNRVLSEYDALPEFDDDFRRLVHTRLDRFTVEQPHYRNALRWIDQATAALRPVITLTFSLGLPIEHVVQQATVNAFSQLASETAIWGSTTLAGDAIATAGASEGMKLIAALFRDLQRSFVEQRSRWLERLIDEHLLGETRRQLERGAQLAKSPSFVEVQKSLGELSAMSR